MPTVYPIFCFGHWHHPYIDLLEMNLPGYSSTGTDNQGSSRPSSKSVNLLSILQRAHLKVVWAIRVWPEDMEWPLTLGLA